jgi:hypothetical protein
MYSKEEKEQDALCKLLLEEALMRIAEEHGVRVDRVEWRDLAPELTGPTLFEHGPGKAMKVWSANRWHYLNLTMEEFQGCLSKGSTEQKVEGKMLAFLREHYLHVWDR